MYFCFRPLNDHVYMVASRVTTLCPFSTLNYVLELALHSASHSSKKWNGLGKATLSVTKLELSFDLLNSWGRWKRGTGKRGTIKNAGVENAGQPSMEREMFN